MTVVTLPSSGHLHCRGHLSSWPCWCWRDWIIISYAYLRTHFHISLHNKVFEGETTPYVSFFPGGNDPKAAKYPPVTLVSPPTPADSANLRPNRTGSMYLLKKKKKKSVYKWTSQLKPMLFKGQPRLLTLMWSMFSTHPAEGMRNFSLPVPLLPTLTSASRPFHFSPPLGLPLLRWHKIWKPQKSWQDCLKFLVPLPCYQFKEWKQAVTLLAYP